MFNMFLGKSISFFTYFVLMLTSVSGTLALELSWRMDKSPPSMFCIEKLIVIFFNFRLYFFYSKVCKYSFPLIFAYSSRETVQEEGHTTVCAVVNQLRNWCFYFTKIYFSLFKISLLLSRLTTALAVLSHFLTSLS